MKVVLFCGGQGLRLRDYSENVPKPMVPICNRPLLGYAVERFLSIGVKEIVVNLHHLPEVIERYLTEETFRKLHQPMGTINGAPYALGWSVAANGRLSHGGSNTLWLAAAGEWISGGDVAAAESAIGMLAPPVSATEMREKTRLGLGRPSDVGWR